MSDNKDVTTLLFSQLEEALEERQTPDRRQAAAGVPEGVEEDRRKGDRRDEKVQRDGA